MGEAKNRAGSGVMPLRVWIDEGQQIAHIFGEVLGFAVGPTLFYAAVRSPRMSRGEKTVIGAISLVTLAIDGYLLARWLSR